MPAPASEADVIFNRANVALAKSQRLIASWLPPRTGEELRNTKSEEEIDMEEQRIFAPTPELLGVGASLPKDVKDGDGLRQELSSNDKLRKQLLGNEFARLYGKGRLESNSGSGMLPVGSKPRPVIAKVLEEDENDDGGRSSVGKPKRDRQAHMPVSEHEQEHFDDAGSQSRGAIRLKEQTTSSKRARSYLDEVLAEKMRKKARKKQKSKYTEEDILEAVGS